MSRLWALCQSSLEALRAWLPSALTTKTISVIGFSCHPEVFTITSHKSQSDTKAHVKLYADLSELKLNYHDSLYSECLLRSVSTLILEGCLCPSLNLPSLASPKNSYKRFFPPSLSKSCLSFRTHFLHEADSSSLAHVNSISRSAIICLQLVSNRVMFSDYLISLIFKSLHQLNLLKSKKKTTKKPSFFSPPKIMN